MYTQQQIDDVRAFLEENKGEWVGEPDIPSLPPDEDGSSLIYEVNAIAEAADMPLRMEEHGYGKFFVTEA
jgi:hypothetical protein